MKSDLEYNLQSCCHHHFGDQCRDCIVKEMQELKSKLYNFLMETYIQLKVGKIVENKFKTTKKVGYVKKSSN